jgi:hypothetical protein
MVTWISLLWTDGGGNQLNVEGMEEDRRATWYQHPPLDEGRCDIFWTIAPATVSVTPSPNATPTRSQTEEETPTKASSTGSPNASLSETPTPQATVDICGPELLRQRPIWID